MAHIKATDGFETLAIHAGQEPDELTGAVVPPIYQASTYKQDGVGGVRGGTHAGASAGAGRWIEGYEYSRTANPTRGALEECLAALEGGTRALAFASGMAAEDCLIRTICQPGDQVLIPHDAYGGTYRLFDKVLAGWGLRYYPVPISDPAAVRAAVAAHGAKLIWVETPTNPLLSIADIGLLAEIAHSAGALLAVDNTFASPYLQQPLSLGADAVVHSTTKYIGGHSDVVGGAIVVPDAELAERLAFMRNAIGSVGGPFDAWLTLRGVKTLSVRMDRHCANALAVATMLASHPKVAQVYYPGLAEHPGHEVAAKQMRGFGGMVSFLHADGPDAAIEMCGRTRLFTLGESLGGVESLIEYPATMTHASVASSPLAVPPDLVRLSVGIENGEDLIEDLRAALGAG
ncbi:MAG TPA: cystathionine gamma-synthase [Streptosporangiaceae bacterium]|nr:cystathionine gamma-synthase [Streptosporangiaceae bacterium]